MTRAIDQLEGRRTDEALPHEMAALQGLLQAQAEVRRREVAQQAGASMGGLGRQGQDLSALFDKELQRQQRTNYETRSQTDARADKQEGESALDRIRDLARRQEELSRRQRELANAAPSGDELKRQLEKLTREQEELRQQAEELTRQMGQQGGQPQRGASPQPTQAGGGAMRDASRADAKRSGRSCSDSRRQPPRTGASVRRPASVSSNSRCAATTRRRSSAPPGELRLEAQQIADEQRRIAGEAARLAKGADRGERRCLEAALRGERQARRSGRCAAAHGRAGSRAPTSRLRRHRPAKKRRRPRRHERLPDSRLPAACVRPPGRCATRAARRARLDAPPNPRLGRERRRPNSRLRGPSTRSSINWAAPRWCRGLVARARAGARDARPPRSARAPGARG